MSDEKQEQDKLLSVTDSNKQQRYWPTSEHIRYLNCLYKYGKRQLGKMSDEMKTKKIEQIRSHQQKYLKKLESYIGRAEITAD